MAVEESVKIDLFLQQLEAKATCSSEQNITGEYRHYSLLCLKLTSKKQLSFINNGILYKRSNNSGLISCLVNEATYSVEKLKRSTVEFN